MKSGEEEMFSKDAFYTDGSFNFSYSIFELAKGAVRKRARTCINTCFTFSILSIVKTLIKFISEI